MKNEKGFRAWSPGGARGRRRRNREDSKGGKMIQMLKRASPAVIAIPYRVVLQTNGGCVFAADPGHDRRIKAAGQQGNSAQLFRTTVDRTRRFGDRDESFAALNMIFRASWKKRCRIDLSRSGRPRGTKSGGRFRCLNKSLAFAADFFVSCGLGPLC